MAKNTKTINLIKQYQLQKRVSGRCRFIPSCSSYAIEAYQKFNWFYATLLTIWRIIRCNPLTKRRIDNVPLTRYEKQRLKLLTLMKYKYDPIYIETILQHQNLYPLMETIDYIVLTIEYLQGSIVEPIYNTNFPTIVYTGPNYLRISLSNNRPSPKGKLNLMTLKPYLPILEELGNNGFINFNDNAWNCSSLHHSETYMSNYSCHYTVVKTSELSDFFWYQQIEKFFLHGSPTIIGIDNIDYTDLLPYIKHYNATVINTKQLTKRFLKQLTNEQIIFINGGNLFQPQISYHLNCTICFFNDVIPNNYHQYNLLIPLTNNKK